MKRLRTLAEFQKEAALGLGALALMLLGVNVAANWALFGVTEQLRESNRTELTTLAFELATRVERNDGAFDAPGSGASTAGILYSARLIAEDLSVVQYGRSAPSAVNDLPALERLRELFAEDSAQFSQFRYLRDSRSNWALFHCPVLISGEWRALVVTRETSLLARLETASQALFWVGAALIALLGVVIIAVFRAVSRPFERIQSQIATVTVGERDA
ncbi:MAG TPA: hypothetical protein VLB27_00345, partial [candidate division Zixibacteria bacterium]|nr:hypothetical protein [candidate division Zixibacteria bacterium]